MMLKLFYFSKEIGGFLNTDEAIAMGSIYQAAHLSQGFKVKRFEVQELNINPIEVSFNDEKDILLKSRTLYGYKSNFSTKRKFITFNNYTDDFVINLNYGNLTHLSADQLL